MPVKRRQSKARSHRITPQAIAAFKAGDYLGLHRALGLKPWEVSPLPRAVHSLGVDDGECKYSSTKAWGMTWKQAQELQKQLIEAARKQ